MKLKAFTLVELLVVMAIISFLSVGAFAGLSYGLRQSRDVQKKKLVDLAHTALQAYYADYAAYPKCSGTSPASAPGLSGTNWYYCPSAFPIRGLAGSGFLITSGGITGLRDYLEGEWPTSNANADPVQGDKYLRYYINTGSGGSTGTPLKFAVCITVENKNANSNLVRKNSTDRDCYCAGADYAEVACAGMESR